MPVELTGRDWACASLPPNSTFGRTVLRLGHRLHDGVAVAEYLGLNARPMPGSSGAVTCPCTGFGALATK